MSTWQTFVRFFTSLRLTVVLLALSIVLVFWATIAQTELGIWEVQERFFRSFFVLIEIPGTRIPIPAFPGGYFLGGLLLINLIASHIYRFKFTWRKAGIQLTHFGLILLLLGELFTSLWQEDYQLRLDEGQTKNYSESFRDYELAITETTHPDFDDVVVIPDDIVARGEAVQHPKLPFRVVPRVFLPNANLMMKDQLPAGMPSIDNTADQGIGPRLAIVPMRLASKENERNLPSALVELVAAEQPIGTWLVSPMLVQPQTFTHEGRSFRIELRLERAYKPFSLTLLELRHDVYPGSDIPKNFSSRVRIEDADGSGSREALIYMNNPLRYGGLTFYQYQMDQANNYSVLQVVRNPSWLIPYIACALMALGLTWQFSYHLLGFSRRRRK